LPDQLCAPEWLDGLDDALEAVYRGDAMESAP
jgi:hypothetical protein